MPQAPSTGSFLIRDPSIVHRSIQILWTEADRDLAQDTRYTGMKENNCRYPPWRLYINKGCSNGKSQNSYHWPNTTVMFSCHLNLLLLGVTYYRELVNYFLNSLTFDNICQCSWRLFLFIISRVWKLLLKLLSVDGFLQPKGEWNLLQTSEFCQFMLFYKNVIVYS